MTNTSFEDRLPQPLPEGARVAHKIGSYGDTTEGTVRSAIQSMSLAAYESLASLAQKSRENRGGSGTTAGGDTEHEVISR